MHTDELNDLASRFAKRLFASYPEWTALARVGTLGDLIVETRSPSVNAPNFGVWTEGDEISVSFDGWHTHLGAWLGQDVDAAVDDAIVVIEGIVNDQLGVEITVANGRLSGGRLVRFAEGPEPELGSWKVEPAPPTDAAVAGHSYLRSWTGRWDRGDRPPVPTEA